MFRRVRLDFRRDSFGESRSTVERSRKVESDPIYLMMSKIQRTKGGVRKHRFTKAWMHDHVTDPFVREAQTKGYRSRAAFKLLELADKDRLLRRGMTVVDLGAAPGSWCQVLKERVGASGRIVAVDLLPMDPVPGVKFIQGDFREDETLRAVRDAAGAGKVDLVLSDLSPNISGIESADQARSVYLGERALEFAHEALQPGGDLVVKAFQGAGFSELERQFRACFDKVYVRKPKASRDRSREVFLVAKGFRPSSTSESSK